MKLQTAGEKIALRSYDRAIRRWRWYRWLQSGMDNYEASNVTFPDYMVERTARKGRVTALIGLRAFSTFTMEQQQKAAETSLRKLIADRWDCWNIEVSTSFMAGSYSPGLSTSAWRATKTEAQGI